MYQAGFGAAFCAWMDQFRTGFFQPLGQAFTPCRLDQESQALIESFTVTDLDKRSRPATRFVQITARAEVG